MLEHGDCRIQGLSPLLDPVEGMVYSTKFPGDARGSPVTKPIGYWAPYRPGVRSAREGDVYPPA